MLFHRIMRTYLPFDINLGDLPQAVFFEPGDVVPIVWVELAIGLGPWGPLP
jgi:hypothetical protein